LTKREENYLNGKLSSFVDRCIRTKKVWSHEQIYYDFIIELRNKKIISPFYDNSGNLIGNSEEIDKWILLDSSKEDLLQRILKHYENKSVAKMNANPMFDLIKCGCLKQNNFYELGYGRLKGHVKMKLKDFKKIDYIPWSIKHINSELRNNYSKDLISILEELSTSHLEKTFYKYWIKNYYSNENNPALIPEFCGTDKWFCYSIKDLKENNIVLTNKTFLFPDYNVAKIKNFRYDFLIVNSIKNLSAVIELDGYNFHSNREQQKFGNLKITRIQILTNSVTMENK
jgi:hypothetical protein